jgi:hypothetical protein
MGKDLIQPSADALRSEWHHSFGACSPCLALPQFCLPFVLIVFSVRKKSENKHDLRIEMNGCNQSISVAIP